MVRAVQFQPYKVHHEISLDRKVKPSTFQTRKYEAKKQLRLREGLYACASTYQKSKDYRFFHEAEVLWM